MRNKAVRQCNDLHAERKVFFLGKSKDALSKAAVFYIFLECYDKLIRIGKASKKFFIDWFDEPRIHKRRIHIHPLF